MISVIMSTFNGANTLAEAIDSILNQDETKFELLICNDASSDDTLAVLTKYAKRDKRIRIINNEQNLGLPKSLNKCIEQARGAYIARMDDDDISLPFRLKTQIDFLKENPNIDFVGSNINIFDENGIYGVQVYPELPTVSQLFHGNQFAHPAMMIRTIALKRVGGYSEESNVLRIEDYDLWMRMYANGCTGANLQKPILNFRETRTSFRRRSVRSRINIVKLLIRAQKNFKLGLKEKFYILKNILKIFVPTFVYRIAHSYKYRQSRGV